MAWLLLGLLLAGAAAEAAAACPTLPAAPDGTRRFQLTAAPYEGAWQSLAFNGSKWGPELRVVLGETVEVAVTNDGIQAGTAVHWHGQHLRNASWADGAVGLTQGTIAPGATFTYRFQAEPAGTFWLHSHEHVQYGDGLRGPLVVEDPADPAQALYDEDSHLLLLADVFKTTVQAQMEELEAAGMGAGMAMCPGQDLSDVPYGGVEVNGESFGTSGKAAVLTVQPGRRYRFRTINGGSSWALRVGVQGHNVTVIAADASPVAPTPASTFLLTAGQRLDFVLAADQPVANYWINVTTQDGHVSPAILHYEGAPDPATDPAVSATAFAASVGCPADPAAAAAADLHTSALKLGEGAPAPPKESTRQLTLHLPFVATEPVPAGFRAAAAQDGSPFGLSAETAAALPEAGSTGCPGGGSKYCWGFNWNVFEMPTSLLIAAPAGAAQPARTYTVPLERGAVVDLVLVNPSLMAHPMHLHGHAFWVLASGTGNVTKGDGSVDWEAPALKGRLNLADPPLLDTVTVPQGLPGADHSMAGMDHSAPSTAGSDASEEPAAADPHAGHNMAATADEPEAPKKEPAKRAEEEPAERAADADPPPRKETTKRTDPHAGHDMGATADKPEPKKKEEAAKRAPVADPHAGHGRRLRAAAAAHMAADPANPGFAVVRFVADNPGVWAFHCHVDIHGVGMMLVFEVPGWQAPPDLDCAASAPVVKGAPSPSPVSPAVSGSLPALSALVPFVLAMACAWAALA